MKTSEMYTLPYVTKYCPLSSCYTIASFESQPWWASKYPVVREKNINMFEFSIHLRYVFNQMLIYYLFLVFLKMVILEAHLYSDHEWLLRICCYFQWAESIFSLWVSPAESDCETTGDFWFCLSQGLQTLFWQWHLFLIWQKLIWM